MNWNMNTFQAFWKSLQEAFIYSQSKISYLGKYEKHKIWDFRHKKAQTMPINSNFQV